MKKHFLTAFASAFLLVGGMVANAYAADVTFGGQLRPRFEINEQGDFDSNTDANVFINTRIRFNAKAKINDKTSAFIQFQAIGVFGDPVNRGQGSRNPRVVANDGIANVGLHQAYFTLNDFFGLPADLKFGRQEVVLDGHRLMGNTGWTAGAQTHDAIRLTHHHGEHTLVYVFSKGVEQAGVGGPSPAPGGVSPSDRKDLNVHTVWANIKGILGGSLSAYFIAFDDNSFNDPTNIDTAGGALVPFETADTDNNLYNIGLRQAGQLYGIDYRAEAYYQFGDAEGSAGPAPSPTVISGLAPLAGNTKGAALLAALPTYGGAGSGVDRGAYMFGVRAGKTFNNVMWKPSFTLWYDQLSGTDVQDIIDGDFATFDTLFDTGHKFYGYMDLFISNVGAGTAGLGLRDAAIKLSAKPMSNVTLKADIHAFFTDTNLEEELNDLGLADTVPIGNVTIGDLDRHLGEELDLTAVYKYNPNTKIVVGYSHFFADDTFHLVNAASSGGLTAAASDNANWAYIMFDVKF